jgi:alpha-1,6-mannosyltransferase
VVADAFRRLPENLGAKLALIGEGPMRDDIAALGDDRIIMPGYMKSRTELAGWLASADVYVSAMADETFGVSIIEAQASGLPVVGVEAGAMLDRVSEETGRLGPVGDASAMAANILAIWTGEGRAMGERARAHAVQFTWEHSMEDLFGRVYPTALARRASLGRASPSIAGAPLVGA